MAETKEKTYLDFLDKDFEQANKKVTEHKEQAEFHKKQHEYWLRQLESISGLRFRVAADATRGSI